MKIEKEKFAIVNRNSSEMRQLVEDCSKHGHPEPIAIAKALELLVQMYLNEAGKEPHCHHFDADYQGDKDGA